MTLWILLRMTLWLLVKQWSWTLLLLIIVSGMLFMFTKLSIVAIAILTLIISIVCAGIFFWLMLRPELGEDDDTLG